MSFIVHRDFARAETRAQNSPLFTERSASARVNDSIVYHGKLVNPSGQAVTGTLEVTIKIFSPEPSLCLLWSEKQTITARSGGFSMELGYGDNRLSGTGGGAATDFRSVFINNTGLTHSSASCVVGSSYTPSANDDRLMSAEFIDGGVSVAVEKIPIKSVPFAKQASEVGGFGIGNLFKISGAGSAEQFSPEEVTRLKAASAGGSANQILGISGTGGVVEYKSITAGTGIAVTHTSNGIQISATGGGGGGGTGTVSSVGVSGLPLSVSSATSTPMISIAQANGSQAGYLSAADWALFNSKQPAGSYLTGITGAQVTAALGYTPISNTSSSEVISALGYTPQSQLGYTPLSVVDAVIKGGQTGSVTLGSLDSSNVNIKTNNLDRITVTAAGNLGVGTTNPQSDLHIYRPSTLDVGFRIENSNTGNYLRGGADNGGTVAVTGYANDFLVIGASKAGQVLRFDAGGSERFRVKSTGEIGIATTSPQRKLEVQDSSAQVRISYSGSSYTELQSESSGDFSINPATGVLAVTGNVSNGGATFSISPGNGYANLNLKASNSLQANSIRFYEGATSQFNLGTFQSTFRLLAPNDGAQLVTVTTGGNFGIGTTSPGDKLHVEGKIRAQEICDTSGSNCKMISSGWTAGSVTSVGVGGAPLSVANGTSTPTISISQANGSQAGFLSAADWTSFNNKQPAGAYLTGITGAQVSSALGFTPQAALGFTPVSNALPTNQTFIGDGSGVAAAGFFGVGQLRNASGTAQIPASCAASQTLTWSAVTDVFNCTNIGSLPASSITTGTIDSARLPFGASLWQDAGSGKIHYSGGNVGIGTASPEASALLDLATSTKGLLLPRLTTAQRVAISSPANGLMVYDTDESRVYINRSSTWTKIADNTEVVFRVHRNSVAQSIPDLTPTKVNWTTQAIGGTNFDLTNDEFKATVAGYYRIRFTSRMETIDDSRPVVCYIYKNGSNYNSNGNSSSLTGEYPYCSVDALVYLDVNDTVQAYISHDDTGTTARNLNGAQGSTNFEGFLISGGTGSAGGSADHLGNHVATQNIVMGGHWLSGDGGSEGISVDGGGNVGIGTASPAYKLDVVGDINVSGNFKVNGSTIGSGGSSGYSWNTITSSTTAVVNNAYILNSSSAITVTLPASCNVGDRVRVMGINTGSWTLVPDAGQSFISILGTNISAGINSVNSGDELEVVCVVANTKWKLSQASNSSLYGLTYPSSKTVLAYTGSSQNYVVPAGVTRLRIKAWGAGGGGFDSSNRGGGGAFVLDEINVTPGETLTVVVGGGGASVSSAAWGGGGYSGVLRSGTPLVIAGAGGAGNSSGGRGGAGGCTSGEPGYGPYPGGGGTQSAGGVAGGGTAQAGGLLQGGNGQTGASANSGAAYGGGGIGYWSSSVVQSGGGGGGFYGGGGSGPRSAGGADSGGGGGSSKWSASGTCSAASSNVPGGTTDSDYTSGVGYGSSANATGGHGQIVIY